MYTTPLVWSLTACSDDTRSLLVQMAIDKGVIFGGNVTACGVVVSVDNFCRCSDFLHDESHPLTPPGFKSLYRLPIDATRREKNDAQVDEVTQVSILQGPLGAFLAMLIRPTGP